MQGNKTAHVVHHVHHPDLHGGSGQTDDAKVQSALFIADGPKYVLDPRTDFGLASVRLFFCFREWLVAPAFFVYMAAVAPGRERFLRRFASIGTVRPYVF